MVASFDLKKIKNDFPILQQQVHDKPLVYLDSAATMQKPIQVIDAIKYFYTHDYANVHRAVHALSERSTAAYEAARKKIQHFINAEEEQSIVFTRGTTEAINLVAQCYGKQHLNPGDEVMISTLEHHSNIVPWQMVCAQTGAKLQVIPINDHGELLMDKFKKMLTPNTKIVAVTHISNSLGTINPLEQIIQLAHQVGAITVIDGAQAAPHTQIDVQKLNCDFYAFSGHKAYGPTGIGVLYGKTELLNAMPPYQGGGDMISQVSFTKTLYREIPHKFEAGTPNIVGAIGLGAAIDYLKQLNFSDIENYEHELLVYATEQILKIPKIQLFGTAKHKSAILSFGFEDVHAHDIATILDYEGVAVRAGHHCTMPLMERLHVPATTRASFAIYNTQEDIDIFIKALHKVREVFK